MQTFSYQSLTSLFRDILLGALLSMIFIAPFLYFVYGSSNEVFAILWLVPSFLIIIFILALAVLRLLEFVRPIRCMEGEDIEANSQEETRRTDEDQRRLEQVEETRRTDEDQTRLGQVEETRRTDEGQRRLEEVEDKPPKYEMVMAEDERDLPKYHEIYNNMTIIL